MGLLRDLSKDEIKFCNLLMAAYDAGVCEKISEYRKLDYTLYVKLKNRLVSMGWNSSMASQAIVAWGQAITENVDRKIDTFVDGDDSKEKYYKERTGRGCTTEKFKNAKVANTRQCEDENKEDSILVSLAKARLGLGDDKLLPLVGVPQIERFDNSQSVASVHKSGARECDLEWLFDYTLKVVKNDPFLTQIDVYDELEVGNELFQTTEMAYKIARGKLDILQGKKSFEAIMAAQLYLAHGTHQPLLEIYEMDEQTKERYMGQAKARFEFDKPHGFCTPTDEEMREYARKISYNMTTFIPHGFAPY